MLTIERFLMKHGLVSAFWACAWALNWVITFSLCRRPQGRQIKLLKKIRLNIICLNLSTHVDENIKTQWTQRSVLHCEIPVTRQMVTIIFNLLWHVSRWVGTWLLADDVLTAHRCPSPAPDEINAVLDHGLEASLVSGAHFLDTPAPSTAFPLGRAPPPAAQTRAHMRTEQRSRSRRPPRAFLFLLGPSPRHKAWSR